MIGCKDCVRENKLQLWGNFFLKEKQQFYRHLDDILNKMTCKGAWGRDPQPQGNSSNFFWKKTAILTPFK